jgi:hypothetical protein
VFYFAFSVKLRENMEKGMGGRWFAELSIHSYGYKLTK